MDLLVDIRSRLSINEQIIDHLRAEKMAEGEKKLQSPSLTCATPGMSRGRTRETTSASSRQNPHQPQPAPRKALLAKSGDRACLVYNGGTDPDNSSHPQDLQVCTCSYV